MYKSKKKPLGYCIEHAMYSKAEGRGPLEVVVSTCALVRVFVWSIETQQGR